MTLNDLVRDGLRELHRRVQHVGLAVRRALDLSEKLGIETFVSMQNQYNLAYREEEREMIPLCLSRGVGLIRGARSPAGS